MGFYILKMYVYYVARMIFRFFHEMMVSLTFWFGVTRTRYRWWWLASLCHKFEGSGTTQVFVLSLCHLFSTFVKFDTHNETCFCAFFTSTSYALSRWHLKLVTNWHTVQWACTLSSSTHRKTHFKHPSFLLSPKQFLEKMEKFGE